jgi:replication factor C subunit 3/5
VDPALKSDVITWAAFYEHRIRLGSVSVSLRSRFGIESNMMQKVIFHLEAYVAKIMRAIES